MQKAMIFFLFFSLWAFSATAFSQELVIYPANGQSQDQMEKDKLECYSWAKEQTGFDPMQAPTHRLPPSRRSKAPPGVLFGAALGAPSWGPVSVPLPEAARARARALPSAAFPEGSLGGGVLGGARSHNQQQQDQRARAQWEKEQAQQYASKRNGYNRAYSACMEGRGYTVK